MSDNWKYDNRKKKKTIGFTRNNFLVMHKAKITNITEKDILSNKNKCKVKCSR